MAAVADNNPFQDLHPIVRNEEDEIRKGIFSCALRKFYSLSLDDKKLWCDVVREASAPKAKGSSTAKAVVGEKRERVEDAVVGGFSEGPTTTPSSATENTHDDNTASPSADVAGWAEADVNGYISAYMRTLLDRVIGGSLSNLSAPALRVLCHMVGTKTQARSKDALYNTLASFYFTHCEKLGKRVSKNTIAERELNQTTEMLKSLIPNKHKTAGKRAVTAAVEAAPKSKKVTATADASSGSKLKAKRGTAASQVAQDTHSAHGADAVAGDEGEEEEALEIAYPQAAFSSAAAHRQHQPQEPSSSSSSWEQADLERRVASIVQLYDPVTSAMVVKKLSQMGYREDDAPAVVEVILKRFHQRQLIFYEGGIAYLL